MILPWATPSCSHGWRSWALVYERNFSLIRVCLQLETTREDYLLKYHRTFKVKIIIYSGQEVKIYGDDKTWSNDLSGKYPLKRLPSNLRVPIIGSGFEMTSISSQKLP